MDSKIFLLPATQVEIGVSRKLDGTGQTIIDILPIVVIVHCTAKRDYLVDISIKGTHHSFNLAFLHCQVTSPAPGVRVAILIASTFARFTRSESTFSARVISFMVSCWFSKRNDIWIVSRPKRHALRGR